MAAPTPANKLVLEPNVPQLIALKFPTGKTVESRYGDEKQVYFSLVDGRAAYFSLGVAQSINNLMLGNREPFYVCKRWNGDKKQAARYDVWLTPEGEKERARLENPDGWPAQTVAAIPAQNPPSELEQQLAASLAEVNRRRDGANLIQRRPPTPAAPPQPPAQGTGTHGPAPVPAAPPNRQAGSAIPIKATYGAAMTEFLIMAGRAAREAQKTLGAEGAGLQLDSRDVCALATTAFIQAAREGFIAWRPGEVHHGA